MGSDLREGGEKWQRLVWLYGFHPQTQPVATYGATQLYIQKYPPYLREGEGKYFLVTYIDGDAPFLFYPTVFVRHGAYMFCTMFFKEI